MILLCAAVFFVLLDIPEPLISSFRNMPVEEKPAIRSIKRFLLQ